MRKNKLKYNRPTKRIVNKHIYLQYPFKTYDVTSNTVPKPYFSKDHITYTDKSVTYQEWREVINRINQKLLEELFLGDELKLPSGLGVIRIEKYKPNKRTDYRSSNEIDNWHTDGFCPTLKWYKAPFKNAKLWNVRLPKSATTKLSKLLHSKPKEIYNFTTHVKIYSDK